MLFSWLPHFNRRPFCEEATVSPFIYFARDRNGWGDPVLMLKVKCVFLGEIVFTKMWQNVTLGANQWSGKIVAEPSKDYLNMSKHVKQLDLNIKKCWKQVYKCWRQRCIVNCLLRKLTHRLPFTSRLKFLHKFSLTSTVTPTKHQTQNQPE